MSLTYYQPTTLRYCVKYQNIIIEDNILILILLSRIEDNRRATAVLYTFDANPVIFLYYSLLHTKTSAIYFCQYEYALVYYGRLDLILILI